MTLFLQVSSVNDEEKELVNPPSTFSGLLTWGRRYSNFELSPSLSPLKILLPSRRTPGPPLCSVQLSPPAISSAPCSGYSGGTMYSNFFLSLQEYQFLVNLNNCTWCTQYVYAAPIVHCKLITIPFLH